MVSLSIDEAGGLRAKQYVVENDLRLCSCLSLSRRRPRLGISREGGRKFFFGISRQPELQPSHFEPDGTFTLLPVSLRARRLFFRRRPFPEHAGRDGRRLPGEHAFSGLGFGGGGGIGLFGIVILALILYAAYRFVSRRRAPGQAGAYYESSTGGAPVYQQPFQPAYASGGQEADMETGLRHIRRMDSYFDEAKFRDATMDAFFKIQGAWANRDMSSVRETLTDPMYGIFRGDAERLKAEKKINKLDNIAVRSTDIVEACAGIRERLYHRPLLR